MSRLYGPAHRELQDHFDSRRMADRIEAIATRGRSTTSRAPS